MFLIIDGTNIGCRAYYAMKGSGHGIPVTKMGTPIAGCSIVLRSLPKLIQDVKATHVAVVFDNSSPTFRHRLYPEYKQQRAEKEPQLPQDIAQLRLALETLGIALTAPAGYEADDLIATLATQTPQESKLIYSGDQDLLQLVSPQIRVMLPGGVGTVLDEAAVTRKTQVLPNQIAAYKALAGDSSDNIPGVKGIGKKRAIELLTRYSDIAAMYESIPLITGEAYTKLKAGEDQANLCLKLTTLVRDVPQDSQNIDRFKVSAFKLEPFIKQLEAMGLGSFSRHYRALSPIVA